MLMNLPHSSHFWYTLLLYFLLTHAIFYVNTYLIQGARLTLPVEAAVYPSMVSGERNKVDSVSSLSGCVFFVEQGKIPAVRVYMNQFGGMVGTLLRGGCLVRPAGLCVDMTNVSVTDESVSDTLEVVGNNESTVHSVLSRMRGTLLICDPGDHCVWAFDLSSRILSRRISVSDVAPAFRFSYKNDDVPTKKLLMRRISTNVDHLCHNENNKNENLGLVDNSDLVQKAERLSNEVEEMIFSPVAIVCISPGVFIISDQSHPGELLRYFSRPAIKQALSASHSQYQSIQEARNVFHNVAGIYLTTCREAVDAAARLKGLTSLIRIEVLEEVYKMEVMNSVIPLNEKLSNELNNNRNLAHHLTRESFNGNNHNRRNGKGISLDILKVFIQNAPTLSAVAFLLSKLKPNQRNPLIACTRDERGNDNYYISSRRPSNISVLEIFVTSFDFSSILVNQTKELSALLEILRIMPSQKCAIQLLLIVLNDER